MGPRWVGASVARRDGPAKLTGAARFVADLAFPGLLHGVTVRSPVARGRLRAIRFDPAFPWRDFVIVTAADIPGRNSIVTILDDQPCLAAELIQHAEEPVALLAHEDRWALEEARRHVLLDIEPLPPVLSPEAALAAGERIWGSDNVFKSYRVLKGDPDAAFAQAALVLEGEYTTSAQEQLYLEPQGALALANPDDGITVFGSLQCPYYVHKALRVLFGLPADRVRVVQCETGGGFGGKEDYPSMIAGHAALLAWKAGRPVKIIYDRAEDIAATTKRHPSRTRHRTAVNSEAALVAMEIDLTLDGGAYCTLSPVVLSRATLHAAGVYRCPNVSIHSRVVATNHPPHGAFRGFGAPQVIFALERHMDRLARALDLDAAEFRRRNLLRPGDTMPTGQVVPAGTDLESLLNQALEAADHRRQRPAGHGVGLSCYLHGAGFTGSGERFLASQVAIEATGEGRVRVLVANTELGQGADTVLGQIAAESLALAPGDIEVAPHDTAVVPDSGPTVASRTTMVVGKLVASAALGLRRTLEQAGLLPHFPFGEACRRYLQAHGALRSTAQYEPPPGLEWDEERFHGDAYGAYSWAVSVAEVSVDAATSEVAVEDFVAVVDAGTIINPTLATGQVEGGVAQGLGFALSEEVLYSEGRVLNARMTNYIAPTARDVPPVRVIFVENPCSHGPLGAKGLGELPIDGVAPAVINAIHDATGVSVTHAPCTPERLARAREA